MLAEEKAWRHLPRNSQQTMSLYLSHYYFSYKLILLLGVKRATPRQTPHVALSVTFSCPSVYSYCKPSAKRHFLLIH
jgi:hypothetical protein